MYCIDPCDNQGIDSWQSHWRNPRSPSSTQRSQIRRCTGRSPRNPSPLNGYYVHQWFYNGPTLVHTHLLYGNCRVTSDCIPYTDKTPSRHVPQPSITAKIQSNCNHRAHPLFSLPALPSCFVDPPLSSNFKFFSFPSWALNDFISKRAPPFCQRCLHQYQWVFYYNSGLAHWRQLRGGYHKARGYRQSVLTESIGVSTTVCMYSYVGVDMMCEMAKWLERSICTYSSTYPCTRGDTAKPACCTVQCCTRVLYCIVSTSFFIIRNWPGISRLLAPCACEFYSLCLVRRI